MNRNEMLIEILNLTSLEIVATAQGPKVIENATIHNATRLVQEDIVGMMTDAKTGRARTLPPSRGTEEGIIWPWRCVGDCNIAEMGTTVLMRLVLCIRTTARPTVSMMTMREHDKD